VGTTAFWSYHINILVGSPIYAWLYNKAGRVAFVVVLYHSLGNLSGELFVSVSGINMLVELVLALLLTAYSWEWMKKKVYINDDGNKLHVYTKGEGDTTLVFMSGLGTSSPVYDFKVLYNKLSNDYRIAVVERAGYGWSDISSSSRDIDTVVEAKNGRNVYG